MTQVRGPSLDKTYFSVQIQGFNCCLVLFKFYSVSILDKVITDIEILKRCFAYQIVKRRVCLSKFKL